ncbi:hypothetical protein ACP70R_043009 [Stipagrostis hirtigluma subsp. patula]
MLRRAAHLAPDELKLKLSMTASFGATKPTVRLPFFHRAMSLELTLEHLRLSLPPPAAGEFLALERLALKGCRFDTAALLRRCPRLRVLDVGPEAELAMDASQTIHLPFLQELVVEESVHRTRFHIVAPMLEHLSLVTTIEHASVLVPNLKKITLDCSRDVRKIELGNMEQLQELTLSGLYRLAFRDFLRIGHGVAAFMRRLPRLRLLRINMSMVPRLLEHDDCLEELPMTSILILELSTYGHVFVTTVLQLLQKVKSIEELNVILEDSPKAKNVLCIQECSCHHDRNRRIDGFSLSFFRKIKFKGFNGTHSAVSVLEELMSYAKTLEQMIVRLCNEVSTSKESHKHQLLNIFDSYHWVKCQVLDA